MALIMVGISHRVAAFETLERLAAGHCRAPGVLGDVAAAGAAEAAVLSTCCRTEVYASVSGSGIGSARARLVELLAVHAGVTPDALGGHVAQLAGSAVVRHLFRVAAGLDSRMPGEVDVAAQVRAAAARAASAGTLGPDLTRLFAAAVATARRVHRRTDLGRLGRSLGRRAADVALGAMPPAGGAVVLGSGRMATAVVARLSEAGAGIVVCTRDPGGSARPLAALAGVRAVVPLASLPDALHLADALVCTASAPRPLVDRQAVGGRLAPAGGDRVRPERRRPLTIVDLAFPRNVDPAVGLLPGVRLVDLEALVDDSSDDLAATLAAAEAIVAAEAERFAEDDGARRAAPLIRALRAGVENICRAELRRLGVGSDDAARALAAKVLHEPTAILRRAGAAGDDVTLEALRRLLLPPDAHPAA